MLLAMEMPIFPVSNVLFFFSSKPISPFFQSVFCTFNTHCPGLMEATYGGWGKCFPSPSKLSPPRTPCCFPSAWIILVQDGNGAHSAEALSCTGRREQMQLPHSSQNTTQTENKTHMASKHCNQDSCVPFHTSLDREDRKKQRTPHLMLVWEKQAHTQLHSCLSYSPPSCPAGFPFSCAHDFGPPGTEFVLWNQNRTQKNPNARRSVKSHDCFSFLGWHLLQFRPLNTQTSLDTTGLPSFLLGLKLVAPHSSALWWYSKNTLLCPASHLSSAHLHQLSPQTIPLAFLPLIKLSLCSVAFFQKVPQTSRFVPCYTSAWRLPYFLMR